MAKIMLKFNLNNHHPIYDPFDKSTEFIRMFSIVYRYTSN